jgi:hypothetical protein
LSGMGARRSLAGMKAKTNTRAGRGITINI